MLDYQVLIKNPYRGYLGDLTTHVMLNITAHSTATLPVNIVLLLDVSGSMKGAKLEAAQDAAKMLCRQLRDNDIISLLSFGSEVNTLIEATPVAEVRAKALQEIARLQADGVTLLRPALAIARSELKKYAKGSANFAVLITDGYPTNKNGQVDELSEPYLAEAAQYSTDSVSLVTVGLGDAENYNHTFLQQLADKGSGRFEYSPNLTGLQNFFREQLDLMQHSAVSDTEIIFSETSGQLLRIAKVHPEVQMLSLPKQKPKSLKLGPLPADTPQSYILEFVTPEMARSERDRVSLICEFIINYKAGVSSGKVQGKVEITYTTDSRLFEKTDENVAYFTKYLEMADSQVKVDEGKLTGNLKLTVRALEKLARTAGELKLTNQAGMAQDALKKTMAGGLAAMGRGEFAEMNQSIRKTQSNLASLNPNQTK